MGKTPDRFIHFITRLSKHPDKIPQTFLDIAKFACDASMLGYHTIWHVVGDGNTLLPADYEYCKAVCSRPSQGLNVVYSYRYSTRQLYGSNMANYSLWYIRNAVQGYIPERTWVNLLDDDNTVHPELMKVFLELEEEPNHGLDYYAMVCAQTFRYKKDGVTRGFENPVVGHLYNVSLDVNNLIEDGVMKESKINGIMDSSQLFFRADKLDDIGGFHLGYCVDGPTLVNMVAKYKTISCIFSTPVVGAWYNYYTEIVVKQ